MVGDALKDFERGRTVSIPGKRYRVVTTLASLTPSSLQARFQTVGTKLATRPRPGHSTPAHEG